ncbi:MAG: ATP-binding cassette domain-containing protein [Chthoniobacterales bacterium]|nr:ATP-binding cassette domain-containing protein [Chthoniobacterales bacterium]
MPSTSPTTHTSQSSAQKETMSLPPSNSNPSSLHSSSHQLQTHKKTLLSLLSALESLLRFINAASKIPHRWWRRFRKKPSPVSQQAGLLPTLIKVFAAFSNLDGSVLEEEIDSCLGFLRYDYPDTVYSELRKMFRAALNEQQDLDAIARKLAAELSEEQKLLLGIQLYDLVARASLKHDQIVAYYSFMANLGMATQAIDIVYQLNVDDSSAENPIYPNGTSPLEVLSFGHESNADVPFADLQPTEKIIAYRYHDLVLIRNRTNRNLILQSRTLYPGNLGRIYSNQRILCNNHVLSFQDLSFYFNAKKNVSHAHVFLTICDNNEILLDRSRQKDSCLEIIFGLKVRVIALKDTSATLRNIPLLKGADVTASLDDKIIFQNQGDISLEEIRRRTRSIGRRFPLRQTKSEYLVSNQPSLLDEGDILLTPGSGGDVLLKIECDYEQKIGRLTVLQADRPIVVRGSPVRNSTILNDGDTIQIEAGQILRCNFSERIIEEERNIISSLEVRDLLCKFPDGETALDNINFSAHRGEMICIMGASGSGKSTLLRTLSGLLRPIHGEILLNGLSLYANFDTFRHYIAYIPQFDAFDEHLTIEENLNFAAAIRAPHLSRAERLRRIENKLIELGLSERRNSIVGSQHKKILSGGERKRLNIGLDMIGMADIYLFDEPTSGLSSKDSEHVLEIIRSIAHNKIILVTIHQPSSKLFSMFHKVLILDKGGKEVFFGTPQEALQYFAEAEHQQQFGTDLGACPACGASRPEFIFDVLETPLRDISGDIIYEENSRGQLVPARRFSPDYWRDRFEAWRLAREVRSSSSAPPELRPPPPPLPRRFDRKSPSLRLRDELFQFRILFARSFISKLRNEANLAITLIMAPLLALLIGTVLRYSESETYDFASAFHIPAYLFLSVVVAMFLGLTNSVDDIIRDRPLLIRERNLNVRIGFYVLAKAITLGIFAALQCLLFSLIGNAILELRGFLWPMFAYLFLTALSGIAIGLLISSLVSESKTAILLIPAVFIPQIILGGSFIKYEEMNRNLDLVYAFQRWFEQYPDKSTPPQSKLRVPLICEFNPMRWSYEAIVYAQAKLNPLTSRQRQIQRQIKALIAKKQLSQNEENRLEDLKELLAILSGLNGTSPRQVAQRLRLIDNVINGQPLIRENILSPHPKNAKTITAEQLYVNQKVLDLINRAEIEESDYREKQHQNIFFGSTKIYFGLRANTLIFNAAVLTSFSLILFAILYSVLHRQLRSNRWQ